MLFVGSVGLLKGSHYLAAASRILERRRVPCEVRVVGPCDPAVSSPSGVRGPTYVGQVPRSRVADEFRQADVFVLPTLCDSFALVHPEAMACGVPVITTPNCGSVVRDGVDGFIVPIRDADAIADKVELLLADRALRQRMGERARARQGVHLGALRRAPARRAELAGLMMVPLTAMLFEFLAYLTGLAVLALLVARLGHAIATRSIPLIYLGPMLVFLYAFLPLYLSFTQREELRGLLADGDLVYVQS